MPWAARSRRQAELPRNWLTIRTAVLHRDAYYCRIHRADRCTGAATQVDHIGDRHDHGMDNLRAACAPCHAWRTAMQGAAAKTRRARPAERHPGLR